MILFAVFVVLAILSRLLSSPDAPSLSPPIVVASDPIENRLPSSVSQSEEDRLGRLKRLLPYSTATCYIILEEAVKPRLVIYLDPNATYENCGASYFLKQYTDLVKGIEVIERAAPISGGLENYQ